MCGKLRTSGTARTLLQAGFLCLAVQAALSGEEAPEAQAPVTIAVLPVRAILADPTKLKAADPLARAAEDALSAAISEISGVELVDRSQLEAVLREQKLSASGILDADTAARAGKLVKARVVVVGTLQPSGAEWVSVFKAILCDDARVLWAAEVHGKDAQLAAQAGLLAEPLRGALSEKRVLERTAPSAEARPLLALRHHERAGALAAQGAHPEAASEEISALMLDPGLADADVGFIEALEKAGFPQLAKAEALNLQARRPQDPVDPRLRRLTELPDPPPLAPADIPETRSEVSLKKLQAWLDAQAQKSDDPRQCALDCIRVGLWLAKEYAAQSRDRRALEQYHETLRRIWALRAVDPQVMLNEKLVLDNLPLSPATQLIERMADARVHNFTFYIVPLIQPAIQQGLPPGAVRPPQIHQLVIPILDQAYIQRPQRHPQEGPTYDYLFKIDFSLLPKNGQLVAVQFASKIFDRNTTSGHATRVSDDWAGAQASWKEARAGQAWRSVPDEQGPHVKLHELLMTCGGNADPITGIRLSYNVSERIPCTPREHLIVKYFFGKEAAPASFVPDALTCQEQAVFCALKRKLDEADAWVQKGLKVIDTETHRTADQRDYYRNFLNCLITAARKWKP
jgi:hypothetical protein